MNRKKHPFTASYLYLAGAMFISGSAVVVGKIMAASLPVFLATELGIGAGLFFLIPILFFIKKEPVIFDLRLNIILLLQALFGVFFYRIFIFWGLRYTTAADSGLITSASPALVAVMAYLFLKERMTRYQVAGISLVVMGLLFINLYPALHGGASDFGSIRGNLLILSAVFCEALFSILSKVACKTVSAIYRTTVITLYSFVLLSPFALFDGLRYDWSAMNLSAVLCVIYYGAFVSFLSYVFWFKGIEKVPAGYAAVFTSVVPVSSILLSALILKEQILYIHIAGLFCILAGIITSSLGLACRRMLFCRRKLFMKRHSH